MVARVGCERRALDVARADTQIRLGRRPLRPGPPRRPVMADWVCAAVAALPDPEVFLVAFSQASRPAFLLVLEAAKGAV